MQDSHAEQGSSRFNVRDEPNWPAFPQGCQRLVNRFWMSLEDLLRNLGSHDFVGIVARLWLR